MVRIKYRYLLINILYPARPTKDTQNVPSVVQFYQSSLEHFTHRELKAEILKMVETLFGEYGVGIIQGSLQVKYFSPATSTGIIRVARAHYRLIWAALTAITHLPKPNHDVFCVISVLRVSGTIIKAEEHAISVSKDMVRRVRGSVKEFQADWGTPVETMNLDPPRTAVTDDDEESTNEDSQDSDGKDGHHDMMASELSGD